MRFDSDALTDVRRFVEDRAAHAGLDPLRSDDLVLAVNEIVTNSVRYGGGQGVLKMWETADTSISEVRDSGHIDGPMIGRLRPTPNESGGFGVWIANQVCDLVQVRSFTDGSIVRLHMRRR
jgi:anti-sigma regulatory factor (Ser/Thr protein kinase)